MADLLVPTAFLFFAGALIAPFLPRLPRAALLVALPVLAGWQVWSLPEGALWQVSFFGFDLELMRVDRLSRLFGLVFCLAAFLGNLYAWHLKDRVQQAAALAYAGSAIGAVFAGDLISLFFYWEGTAIASVFLIWARGTEGAYATGLRYLVIQIASGVILLAGAVLYYAETGGIAFEQMTLGSLATWLIFIGFGIKCAFPFLHNWLPDAYPAATVTGAVVLSAFTTKMAVYALARGFAGTELLIWIGAAMAIFTLLYAVIENDLRRVLAYALNNQLGFMVVAIGVGTDLALNGAAAQAVAHILYKSLLFMSMGAVLYRTGTARASDLGGLYRTMPLTMLLCVIGGLAMSTPLFAGFVTKSLILSGAAKAGYFWVWAILLGASAGVFLAAGLRLPYAAFFGRDSGLRPKEAPGAMLLAMGLTAALCVLVGVSPQALYALLPYDVTYEPYTVAHVITQLQLLGFAALAFGAMQLYGLFPAKRAGILLDFDWTYRRAGLAVLRYLHAVAQASAAYFSAVFRGWFWGAFLRFQHSTGPEGRLAQSWPTGAMVLWIAILLGVALLVNFLS